MTERTLSENPAPVDHVRGNGPVLARVASIICEETCGLTSECKSREAAKALLDKGYLQLADDTAKELAIRKAGQVAIAAFLDEWFDRKPCQEADDLADYLPRIVDACVGAALSASGGSADE